MIEARDVRAHQREQLSGLEQDFMAYRKKEITATPWTGFWQLVARPPAPQHHCAAATEQASKKKTVATQPHALRVDRVPVVYLQQAAGGGLSVHGWIFDGDRKAKIDPTDLSVSRQSLSGASIRDVVTRKLVCPLSMSLGYGAQSVALWFEWKARGFKSMGTLTAHLQSDSPLEQINRPDALLVRAMPRFVVVSCTSDLDGARADAVCEVLLHRWPNHFAALTVDVSLAGTAPFQSVRWRSTSAVPAAELAQSDLAVAHDRNPSTGFTWALSCHALHAETLADSRLRLLPATTKTLAQIRAFKYPTILCHADISDEYRDGANRMRLHSLQEMHRQFEPSVTEDAFPTLTGPAATADDAADGLFTAIQQLRATYTPTTAVQETAAAIPLES